MDDLREVTGVSRRTVLIAAAGAAPLLAIMSAGAGVKVSQSSVHYQPTPKDGQDCGHCSHESPHFVKDSCWPYFAAKS